MVRARVGNPSRGWLASAALSARPPDPYRRDAFTWTAFGALFAFGYLNAALGPALPFLRSSLDLSYAVGALHQVAFAIGSAVAGVLSARGLWPLSRQTTIAGGLLGAALVGLGIGYGPSPVVTVGAALVMGFLATSALIRIWAAVADAHARHRAVAMTEGEVAVSLAGIVTPLVIAGVAATAGTWRLAFVIGAVATAVAVLAVLRADVPPPGPGAAAQQPVGRIPPTLVIAGAVVGLEFALTFWLASYLVDGVGLTTSVAVTQVSVLYLAHLAGRLVASRLARVVAPDRLLLAALALVLVGSPALLAATSLPVALIGIVVAGAGTGALFPLTSALHVQASARPADTAIGEVLLAAAPGQVVGPLAVGLVAQVVTLRAGLVTLPVLALIAVAALVRAQTSNR